LFVSRKLKTNMAVQRKCNVGGDLNAVLSVLEGIEDGDSSSDGSVRDSEGNRVTMMKI
jgi:hypothetical protein